MLRPSCPHQPRTTGTMDSFPDFDDQFSPIHEDLILNDPLPWDDVLGETTAIPAFPVFDGLLVDGPLGAPNKGKSTDHSDVVLEDAKVADTPSTGPVSFKDGNNDGNVSLSPNNIENHPVSPGEYGARADSNNSVGRDSNSEQPIPQTVAACESYDRYLNRVYRAYLKRRAEIEAKIAKSQISRNHRQVDTSEIQPDPEKYENEGRAMKKRKANGNVKDDGLYKKKRFSASKNMSADKKQRFRNEQNRSSATRSQEFRKKELAKNKRFAYGLRIDNESMKKAVLLLKKTLQETQTHLLKKMDVVEFGETFPTIVETLDNVAGVIADTQLTFRPADILLTPLDYGNETKKQ